MGKPKPTIPESARRGAGEKWGEIVNRAAIAGARIAPLVYDISQSTGEAITACLMAAKVLIAMADEPLPDLEWYMEQVKTVEVKFLPGGILVSTGEEKEEEREGGKSGN